jgi:Tat protein secretion system quality control protein TatD with DNase activity
MKLSLTLHNKTHSIESDESFDGSNVYDLAEQFKGLLVSAGFHPSNVDSIFDLDYQWFTEEERADNLQGHYQCADIQAEKRYAQKFESLSRESGFLDDPKDSDLFDKMSQDAKVKEFQDNMYKPKEPVKYNKTNQFGK